MIGRFRRRLYLLSYSNKAIPRTAGGIVVKALLKLIIPAIAAGSMLAVAALPSSAAIAKTATVRPSITVDSTTYYQLKNHDGKCLDMTGASKSKGTPAQQWACNGNAQQYWAFVINKSNEDYLIKNYHSGLCLSIKNNDAKGGGEVWQWPCSDSNAFENWSFYYTHSGDWYILYNTAACDYPEQDSCGMHPDSNSTANGAVIYDQVPSSTAYYWEVGSAR
jgi:hypothetical protein